MAEDDFDLVTDEQRQILNPDGTPPELERRAADMDALRKQVQAKQDAYRRWMTGRAIGDDMRIVTDDLRFFCRADSTTFHENERYHTLLTGRQEVWLRIQEQVKSDLDTLVAKQLALNEGS